ncbi:putative NBD/HSP70 family sugar kinase [Streptomyces zagrosensis]|uniref:Putative NBD/HSP70 family sugar kinase n=1 Tax=Streptomyces zagrosensis TaxID=1042984 RepID=A0A7W9Q879_9ACTN|nr:putative NBD/HSP70 family sugar kinase [Streptomyces zagrosensis]
MRGEDDDSDGTGCGARSARSDRTDRRDDGVCCGDRGGGAELRGWVGPSDGAGRGGGVSGSGAVGSGGGQGANLAVLREHNAALVLGLLRAAGPAGASRLEIAEKAGLTPQAVSKITTRLRADGLVAEAGQRPSTGGKPRTVLRLVPEAGYAIGLRLDRDGLMAVLTNLAGDVLAQCTSACDFGGSANNLLGPAVDAVTTLRRAAQAPASAGAGAACAPGAGQPARSVLLGVGVACPGPLDYGSGTLHRVTGFPQWDGFPLRAELARRLGLPVVLDKDTNAAALCLAMRAATPGPAPGSEPTPAPTPAPSPTPAPAGKSESAPESPSPSALSSSRPPTAATIGSALGGSSMGAGAESFAYLHLGTGLGAGLVIGGAVHRGARTGAGEFGHQVVLLDGPHCACGDRGCLEALCLAAVAEGDDVRAARLLGVGAANLVRLLDIDRVLLGGRVVLDEPETYARGVAAALAADAARGGGGGAVPVAVAAGGERLVAKGAAHLVLAPFFGR